LEGSFGQDNGWIDVFHALGIVGVEPVDNISIPAQLEFLLTIGYLERANPSQLQISVAGAALAGSLSDPEQVSITIGFTSLHPERACTSVFLVGWIFWEGQFTLRFSDHASKPWIGFDRW
jgi:hypothetical protein